MSDPQRNHRVERATCLGKGALFTIALLVGGCSLGSILERPASIEPDGEPEYRKMIAEGAASLFPSMPAAATTEVSALRRSLPVQPGDWIACLRRTAAGETAFFAVFFRSHKIDTVRRAVLVDKCEQVSYGPLPNPAPPKKEGAK
jgi:hypothetical protein